MTAESERLTQAEKRGTVLNDARVREQGGTFFSHTHLDDGGRFAAIKPTELVGSTLIPRYPGPGQCDPVPIEPSLGIDVNAMLPCGDLSQPKEVLPIINRIQSFLADLEAHTSMLVHHTPKDGKGFWGSVIIEGTVHAMIHCQVNENIPDTATLICERMKGTRKFAPIDVTLQTQVIKTEPDEDGVDEVEELVVISGAPAAVEATKKAGKEVREEELNELMWITALNLSRPPERLIQYTAWFELTKANRGGKLGTETFDKAVKRLCKNGTVRKVGDLYQVVVGDMAEATSGSGTGFGTGSGPSPSTSPFTSTSGTSDFPSLGTGSAGSRRK
jgi:hypothetical protein